MKKIAWFLLILSVGFVFAATKGAMKQSPMRAFKAEPTQDIFKADNQPSSPIQEYNFRNGFEATLIDSSMNGYGMVVGQTRPMFVSEFGWALCYRQWAGATGPSGQIGTAYSEDGYDWTTYQNINNGMGAGRYPSAAGTDEYPYAFWNEYTTPGGATYGGRLYYSYDEFGWDGGSWTLPENVDILWNDAKDHWVGVPSVIDYNGGWTFNVISDDWTREDMWFFHSEAYEDGYVVFSEESVLFDEGGTFTSGDDDGSYMSSGVIEFNNDGIGYAAVTAYFLNGPDGGSPYSNYHTLAFNKSTDAGATWEGNHNGSGHYYLPNDVLESLFEEYFETEYSGDTTIVFDGGFLTYDWDMKVDSQGDPHFIIGVLPTAGDGVYPGISEANGYYHLTVDHTTLDNGSQGDWSYSFVASTQDTWIWEDLNGDSYWQIACPNIAIDPEDDDNLYVTSSLVNTGAPVDENGDPCDPDDPDGPTCYYPEWSEDVYVWRSLDGGANWWCGFNATATPDPDPENDLDNPEETYAHIGAASGDMLHFIYQMPDWPYGSTTGDPGAPDHRNRIYVGHAELTEEPECPDDLGCTMPGDANDDNNVDVLDIVTIVNYILSSIEPANMECADANSDTGIDVLDIVTIVNIILGNRAEDATSMRLVRTEDGMNIVADGFVGGVQIVLTHCANFQIEMPNNALFADYATNGNSTTIIVAAPQAELFATNSDCDYSVESVIASADGLSKLDVTFANGFALLNNYPNPFNPETTINYELYTSGNVTLDVYNMNGQLVNSLVNGYQEAGFNHQAVWNGTDMNGNPMSSGVYLMKLSNEGQSLTRKITLLR